MPAGERAIEELSALSRGWVAIERAGFASRDLGAMTPARARDSSVKLVCVLRA